MHLRRRNPGAALSGLTVAGLLLASFESCESAPAPPAPKVAEASASGGFLTADQCARCHSRSPKANALTTAAGDDASPHGLWQATPMANAFRDPYWRAQMAAEVERDPAARAATESLCLRCHAPMASHAAALEGRPSPSMRELQGDALAHDGVSCMACHRVQPDGLGAPESFGGRTTITEEKSIFGPFEDPTTGPMRMNTGFTPTAAKHISSSALCGTCHTLTTGGDEHGFLEQAPYLEWRNSVFSDETGASETSRTCQACHMPDLGRMKIARMPTGDDFFIKIRDGVRGHVLVGGNAWLVDLLRLNRDELGVTASDAALRRTAASTRSQLAFATAKLAIESAVRDHDHLRFELAVENLAGHKLPSGYPARRAWLQVEVRAGRQVIFSSGGFDASGKLQGVADELDLPHVARVERESDVPVYEMVARDAAGRTTTSLLAMSSMKKDTRLLPRGWRADGPHARETAPVGVAGDADFTDGGDRVPYDLAIAHEGPLTIVAWLRYQPIPPAWVAPLRASRTSEAAAFVRMLDAAQLEPETLALAILVVD
ncbi:MAG TPA: multiheme c-type cytochrome [Planctomycetota bacterium]|nr:multiheme c-type cytochrome [Planctomycetota bacterium]